MPFEFEKVLAALTMAYYGTMGMMPHNWPKCPLYCPGRPLYMSASLVGNATGALEVEATCVPKMHGVRVWQTREDLEGVQMPQMPCFTGLHGGALFCLHLNEKNVARHFISLHSLHERH